jgi:hypothetical protein
MAIMNLSAKDDVGGAESGLADTSAQVGGYSDCLVDPVFHFAVT